MSTFFQNKKIIGMIHLDNIVDLNNGTDYIDEVYNSAKEDLISLQKGGVDAAIVENFFDQPYSTILTLEQIIAYTSIFSRLRSIAEIPLGVNLQQTNNTEEMAVASIIGGDFIRSETFVETRMSASGILKPQASKLERYRRNVSSDVSILADIEVKHSQGIVNRPVEDIIDDAITSGADALIITGEATGKDPRLQDIKEFKDKSGGAPILIGSGVNSQNIKSFLDYSDGVIVGSSIKENSINSKIDSEKVKELVREAKK